MSVPPSSEDLAKELAKVSRRQLDRAFGTVHGQPSIDAPCLFELVEKRDPEAWQADPVQALYAAIGEAASRLADETIREAPSLTFGYVITKLFNLTREDLGHVDGHRYDYLLEQLFGSDRALKKKVAERVRLRLAKELLTMKQETIDRREQLALSRITAEAAGLEGANYIQRARLEAALSEAVSTSRVVVISGEGGVGKTTLVREHARRHALSDQVFFVHVRGNDFLDMDIFSELERIGALSTSERSGHAVNDLRKVMADPKRAPQLVLLDDVEDIELLKRLIPDTPRSTVLLTSRRAILPKGSAPQLIVGEMTEDEATTLIWLRLPDASAKEVNELSHLRRPIAIEHICAYLAERSHAERERFIGLLKQRTASLLGLASAELGKPSLHAVYAEIVDGISADPDNWHAVRLLEIHAALLLASAIPFYVMRRCFGELTKDHYNDAQVASVAFDSAIRVLERYRLATAYIPPYPNAKPEFEIHSLTEEMLGDILRPQLHNAFKAIVQTIIREWDALAELGRDMPSGLPATIEWVYRDELEHAVEVASRLFDDPLFYEVAQKIEASRDAFPNTVTVKIFPGGCRGHPPGMIPGFVEQSVYNYSFEYYPDELDSSKAGTND